jgi:enoyl-CoA hydratase/carnithine racemase
MISTHQNGSTVTLMVSARAINPFSSQFRGELATAIAQLETQRAQLNGVIVGFNADAAGHADDSRELEHLMALTPDQAADCLQALAGYNALLRRLENLGLPVIATLSDGEVNGHALGLALACHRRFALHDTTFAMPQVRQGLAPVAGEIARTVRLTGLQAAMPLLMEGATWSAAQAREAGLLHGVAADDTEMADQVHAIVAAESARRSIAHGTPDSAPAAANPAPGMQQPWDAKGYKLPGGALNSPAVQALLMVAPAMVREKTGGHYPAPEAILCALVEGLQVDFDTALLIESRYFCQTAIHPVARNLMRLSQMKSDPAYAGVAEFSAAVREAYDGELRQLRADGVPSALLRNAARAAGMSRLPAAEAAALATPAPPASAPPLADVRDRLLYAQSLAALESVGRGAPPSVNHADLASVSGCGFPSFTGGAVAFVEHVGPATFARRAAELGERFSLPARWEEIAAPGNRH